MFRIPARLGAVLCAALLPLAAHAEVTTLKLAHVAPPTSSYQVAAERLNAQLKQLSGGTMQIEIVPGGAMGGMGQLWAQLRAGTLDMHLIDVGAVSVLKEARMMQLVNMPFIFRDQAHWRAYLASPLFTEMMGEAEKAANIKYVGYLGDRPPRALTTQKTPVRNINDIKGLKIRTPAAPVYIEAFKAFGATPTPIQPAEMYAALQSGLVDGQENGIVDVVAAGYVEVQKYFMPLDYIQSGIGVWISGKKWGELTAQQQGWLLEAAKKADALSRAAYDKEMADAIAKAKAKGMVFVDIDRSGFEKAAAALVAAKDGKDWPAGLADKVRAIH
ncbi:MAG: TRAP transporter substrate-binding protein [Candidatus Eiseniibacteriota bacterium]